MSKKKKMKQVVLRMAIWRETNYKKALRGDGKSNF